MNRVNLLPTDYVFAERRRRKLIGYCYAGSLLCLVAAAWAVTAYRQVHALSAEVAAAQHRLAVEKPQLEESSQVEAECRELQTLLAIPQGLQAPLPAAALVALFSELLPERVVLTRLSVEMSSPALGRPEDVGKSVAKVAKPGAAGEPAAQPRLARVELDGVSVGGADVARLVSNLSRHRLLTKVTLNSTRNLKIQDANRVAFKMSLDVSMPPEDRVETAKEEKSHAS